MRVGSRDACPLVRSVQGGGRLDKFFLLNAVKDNGTFQYLPWVWGAGSAGLSVRVHFKHYVTCIPARNSYRSFLAPSGLIFW